MPLPNHPSQSACRDDDPLPQCCDKELRWRPTGLLSLGSVFWASGLWRGGTCPLEAARIVAICICDPNEHGEAWRSSV